ncbi:MAG: phosphatidylglycerophosphatase A [Moraxella sp.]|nr:phosphatidylglycerophosphatase A [Moraxella sp.]
MRQDLITLPNSHHPHSSAKSSTKPSAKSHKPDVRQANPCPPCPTDVSTLDKGVYWLGVGLGSGLPRRAAGTWGTLGGLAMALPVMVLSEWWLGSQGLFYALTVGSVLVGNFICGRTSELMNVHDDPHIVWDEWAGMWIVLVPVASHLTTLMNDGKWRDGVLIVAIAFVLFRIFDIIKPFPIGWADKKVSGGFGIMLDDILAGLMAIAAYMVMSYVWYGSFV